MKLKKVIPYLVILFISLLLTLFIFLFILGPASHCPEGVECAPINLFRSMFIVASFTFFTLSIIYFLSVKIKEAIPIRNKESKITSNYIREGTYRWLGIMLIGSILIGISYLLFDFFYLLGIFFYMFLALIMPFSLVFISYPGEFFADLFRNIYSADFYGIILSTIFFSLYFFVVVNYLYLKNKNLYKSWLTKTFIISSSLYILSLVVGGFVLCFILS